MALASGGGLIAARIPGTSAGVIAAGADDDVPGCTYNYYEDDTPSPQVYWTFSNGTLLGTVKDSLSFDCTPETSPPYVADATASSLWKDIGGTWTKEDPSSGSNDGAGVWSASSDDSHGCGNANQCGDGNTWKQVWSTGAAVDYPFYFYTEQDGCVILPSTEAVTCNGSNYSYDF